MHLLRHAIRLLISEAALGVKDIPDGWIVEITNLDGRYAIVHLLDNKRKVVGEVGMHQADESDGGPCAGAWIVSTTHAQQGWGPLLYDVAIEWASMNAAGLASDREAVSDEAYKVWDFYQTRRSDVKSHQLDTRKNMLTPSSQDNCGQMSTATHTPGSPELEKDLDVDTLKDSPISKYYSKAPSVINALKQAGKIRKK